MLPRRVIGFSTRYVFRNIVNFKGRRGEGTMSTPNTFLKILKHFSRRRIASSLRKSDLQHANWYLTNNSVIRIKVGKSIVHNFTKDYKKIKHKYRQVLKSFSFLFLYLWGGYQLSVTKMFFFLNCYFYVATKMPTK